MYGSAKCMAPCGYSGRGRALSCTILPRAIVGCRRRAVMSVLRFSNSTGWYIDGDRAAPKCRLLFTRRSTHKAVASVLQKTLQRGDQSERSGRSHNPDRRKLTPQWIKFYMSATERGSVCALAELQDEVANPRQLNIKYRCQFGSIVAQNSS